MTAEAFKANYCKYSRMTEEEFDLVLLVIPCECEYPSCEGWQSTGKKSYEGKRYLKYGDEN